MPASCVPTNPLSAFSTTTVKPGLGASFAFATDVELLLQDTGRVFGLVDEGERDRAHSGPGLRVVAEVLKSRVSVGDLLLDKGPDPHSPPAPGPCSRR